MSFRPATSLLLTLLLASCATPYMKKREGKTFTLCCSQCSDDGWAKKLTETCPKAKLTSEEQVEKTTGVQTTQQESEDKLSMTTVSHLLGEKEVCRKYTCAETISGSVSPY